MPVSQFLPVRPHRRAGRSRSATAVPILYNESSNPRPVKAARRNREISKTGSSTSAPFVRTNRTGAMRLRRCVAIRTDLVLPAARGNRTIVGNESGRTVDANASAEVCSAVRRTSGTVRCDRFSKRSDGRAWQRQRRSRGCLTGASGVSRESPEGHGRARFSAQNVPFEIHPWKLKLEPSIVDGGSELVSFEINNVILIMAFLHL